MAFLSVRLEGKEGKLFFEMLELPDNISLNSYFMKNTEKCYSQLIFLPSLETNF